MTPKEKAKELLEKFNYFHDKENKQYLLLQTPEESIRCALICCNEVLGYMGSDRGYSFWLEVKQEIEKL